MRSVSDWLGEYGVSHQNPVNKLLHWICVPPIVLALMGLVSCTVFFVVFRVNTMSLAGAVIVVGCGAWKLRGWMREKPMSLQAWKEHKSKLLRPRVYTEATRAEIPWAAADAGWPSRRRGWAGGYAVGCSALEIVPPLPLDGAVWQR